MTHKPVDALARSAAAAAGALLLAAVPAAAQRIEFEPRAGAPLAFSVPAAEGNYDVTVTLGGDPAAESDTTVWAESRRLVLEKVRAGKGERVTRTFTVNVRMPGLKDGRRVGLKGDEARKLDWDDRLTLRFGGTRPCVAAVEIAPAKPETVTVFLAGDSTVTNQEREPFAAWGQALPRFFGAGVAVANHAHSGESLRSFAGERRLAKIEESIRPGDFLFVQFAHNDQKPGASHVEPFTTYTEELRRHIKLARDKGATPVLVTSMHRRRFDEAGKIVNTLGDYPEAVRRLARAENVALIDLHAASRTLYEAMGVEPSKRAFVHVPAGVYPGQTEAIQDNTHFSDYGAYELARCVADGIRAAVPALAKRFAPDAPPPFDPSRPDYFDSLSHLAAAGPVREEK